MNKLLCLWMVLLLSSFVLAVSVPAGYTVTTIGKHPTATSQYGGVTADLAGNVYVVGAGNREVYKYNATTSTYSLFYTNPTSANLGVTVYGSDIYVGGDDGKIYRVNASGTGSLFATLTGCVNKMVLAPSSFGAYGNQMVVATSSGVFAMNMSTAGVSTIITGSTYDGLAFNASGELLVTNYTSTIYKLSSTGTQTSFMSVSSADGIAINPLTGDIFFTDPSGTIYKANSNGTNITAFATGLNLSGGWYPSGIFFSADGSKLYYTETSGTYGAFAISGFAPVPEPSSFLMLACLCVLVGYRKKIF